MQLEELQQGIDGVQCKALTSHADSRGFFREIIRLSDPVFEAEGAHESFAQWSHSKMAKNTVKAWHYHHRQIDWWYFAIGVAEVVLYDNREESSSYQQKLVFKLGDPDEDPDALLAVVRIPRGVLHGCKVLSESAHLMYITSRTYDPNDEGRFAYDSGFVGHDWGDDSQLIVAENDRRDFQPKYPREI